MSSEGKENRSNHDTQVNALLLVTLVATNVKKQRHIKVNGSLKALRAFYLGSLIYRGDPVGRLFGRNVA